MHSLQREGEEKKEREREHGPLLLEIL